VKGIAFWLRPTAVAKPERLVPCYVAKASIPRSWRRGANGAWPPSTPRWCRLNAGAKPTPGLAQARQVAELTRQIEALRRKLAQAHTIIDVQKKLCTLLGLPTAEEPENKS